MDTPPLKKGTPAEVGLVYQYDRDGRLTLVVIVKERFSVDVRGQVTRAGGAEVQLVDVPWDEQAPEASSIKIPSDLCLRKPSTDVIVVGSAMAPGRRAVPALDVMVRVGPVEKALRVHGVRAWYKAMMGLALTPPQPFEQVHLKWELAWGGADFSDPTRPLEEPRNPLGRGVGHDVNAMVHQPGPQIEDPRDPITSSRGKHTPAGVGAIGRHWMPRRSYTGTMDARWQEERMPLLPLDFDERFHQAAVPELVTPQHLRGGEPVQVLNMHPEGVLQFALPKMNFFVGARTDRGLEEHRNVLDTVVLMPTDGLVEMTWRAAIPMPRRLSDIAFVQVHERRVIS